MHVEGMSSCLPKANKEGRLANEVYCRVLLQNAEHKLNDENNNTDEYSTQELELVPVIQRAQITPRYLYQTRRVIKRKIFFVSQMFRVIRLRKESLRKNIEKKTKVKTVFEVKTD